MRAASRRARTPEEEATAKQAVATARAKAIVRRAQDAATAASAHEASAGCWQAVWTTCWMPIWTVAYQFVGDASREEECAQEYVTSPSKPCPTPCQAASPTWQSPRRTVAAGRRSLHRATPSAWHGRFAALSEDEDADDEETDAKTNEAEKAKVTVTAKLNLKKLKVRTPLPSPGLRRPRQQSSPRAPSLP